jgi:hypothetical protein
MSKKPIPRREAIKRFGVLAAAPVVLGPFHPLVPATQGTAWAPRFFDELERTTVPELCERIIPETDTPGAKRANVHQYIDYVLSQATDEERRKFREGVKALDDRSRTRIGKPFAESTEGQQVELLQELEREEFPFFGDVKTRTIEGYYRSEAGMLLELGYAGNTFVSTFDGCTHEEHLNWTPPGKRD